MDEWDPLGSSIAQLRVGTEDEHLQPLLDFCLGTSGYVEICSVKTEGRRVGG